MTAPDSGWLPVPPPSSLAEPSGFALHIAGVLQRSAEKRAFDSTTVEYFDRTREGATGAWEYYQRFLPASSDRAPRVLDLASGAGGRTDAHLSKSNARFFCIDLDFDTLRAAAGRVRSDAIVLAQADALKLPFADGTFDICLCENALEHLDRPDLALRELTRVLRPEGHLLLMFPPWRGPFSGHLTYWTRLPWIHLLPRPILLRTLVALGYPRWTARGRSAWRDDAHGMIRHVATHLNGWATNDLLKAIASCPGLSCVDAYALGEWQVSRALRFLPWVGEFFTTTIYGVYRKTDRPIGRSATIETYNGLLRHMTKRLLWA